ncbi:unnamed protein product [Urochloa humidicola]
MPPLRQVPPAGRHQIPPAARVHAAGGQSRRPNTSCGRGDTLPKDGDDGPRQAPSGPGPSPTRSAPGPEMHLSDDDLPAGHPLLRPELETCFISRSEEMDAEEARLRFALLAAAPDGRRDFSFDAMRRAVLDIAGIHDDDFSVRRFAPESFLVTFSSQRSRDAAMSAGSVWVGNAQLFFRPWTRLVRASSRRLCHRVTLEIEGIPAHAWSWRVARKLLASSCWIEQMEPSSEERSDLSFMALTAWTDNPSKIPRKKHLIIAEHERPIVYDDPTNQRIFANVRPYLREKGVLQYEVFIHLRRIADFSSRSPSPSPGPSPPSSDGDSGHDDNPDRGYGESRGDGGPRLQGFPPVYGRDDAAGYHSGRGNGQAGRGGARRSAQGPRSSSSPPSGEGPSSPASPVRMTSTPAKDGALAGPSQTSGKDGEGPLPVLFAESDARQLSHPEGPDATDCTSQLVVDPTAPADQTNGNSPFPKRASDKVAAATKGNSRDLIAFEEQVPCRTIERSPTSDPMLFEIMAQEPATILQQLPNATRNGLRTYRRRPRSAAAPSSTIAALQTESVAEPIGRGHSEPATELVQDLSCAPGELCLPSQDPVLEPRPAESPAPEDQLAQLDPNLGPKDAASSKRARPKGPSRHEHTAPAHKRINNTEGLEEAKAATAAFLASVSHALQVPLATMPPRPVSPSPATPAPRRSNRLASQPLNSSIRASKKGEVLVLRKLGWRPDEGGSSDSRQKLASVFADNLDISHFASLRDIFPAARALSDADLMAAAIQARQAVCAC